MDKRLLWRHLESIYNSGLTKPWLLAGDFNIIASASESHPFNATQAIIADIRDFEELRNHILVYDHAYNGAEFTWTNKHQDGFIARKLDRVLISDSWSNWFAHSTVEFLPSEVSDHCPTFIQLQQPLHSPPKPFKFFNLWTKHAGFLQVVEHSWNMPVSGNARSVLHYKLKRLKTELKLFNQMHYGGISAKVVEKRKELATVQMRVLTSPTDELVQLEKSLNLELYNLILAEESFFKQKSRIQWIQEGDQNNKFFHKIVAMQQHRNTIKTLTSAEGIKLNTFSQISEEAINFFWSLFGSRDDQVVKCHFLSELVQSTLAEEVEGDLCKPISAEEIKASMFAIGDDKAPGPDGYTAHFFKKAWDIVGADVIDEVLNFFNTNKDRKSVV